MKYKTSRENKFLDQKSLELIKRVISDIKPDTDGMSDWYYAYAREQSTRIAYDIDYTKKYVKQGGKILEFGAIPLLLTGGLHKLGYNVIGLDIAPDRFSESIASLNLNVIKIDIETEELPFSDEEFDAVIFNEVFEHLRINPIFTLKEVYRVMKPNGILLLSTPNMMSLGRIVNLIFRGKIGISIYNEYSKLKNIGHMGHVREYTTVEVSEFLEDIGFNVQEVIYRGEHHPNKKWKQIVITLFPLLKIFPSLRPFISVIAKR